MAVAQRAEDADVLDPGSAVFGNYADKRELQKVFDSSLIVDAASRPAARRRARTSGSTTSPTSATASTRRTRSAALMAQPRCAVEGIDARAAARAMLVLGGDEVYPTASTRAYEDRTVGPYRSALPSGRRPSRCMFVLPGNHDWYDGLTAFLRLFTQDRLDRRLAHRAEAQLLGRAAAAPLVAGRPRQPARLLLRRPAAEVLRGDPHRQPAAGRQRHRVRGHAGLAQGRRRATPTRSTAWSGSSATS